MQATHLWLLWQSILLSVALGFTCRGVQRFIEWVTGLALNVEEHTITQSLIGLDRVGDWKALESFAEYGSWDLRFSQWSRCAVILRGFSPHAAPFHVQRVAGL